MRKFAFIFLFCCGVAHGQVVFNAADCTAGQVSNAFSAFVAANPVNAIVNIPACSGGVSWASTVTLTIPSANTNLVIQGQSTITGTCGPGGTCAATDTTVIVDGLSSAAPLLIITTGASNTNVRLTGITMTTASPQGIKPNGLINISGNCQNLRIDHNHIVDYIFGSLDVFVHGWQYGVADHNLLDDGTAGAPGAGQGIHVDMESYNSGQFGHKSWADTTQFGSGHAFFIENNSINYGNYMNDCQQGARIVIRYNLLLEVPAQTHPTHGGTGRGCRSTEYYQNSVSGTNGFVSIPEQFYWLSSGTLLIWGNTGPTGYKNVVTVHSMRRDNSTYNEDPTPTGWGFCGTSFNGTGSNWDQNSPATTGFRCLDQPGVGVGDLLAGTLPNDGGAGVLNTTTGTIAWPHQALEPIYEWLDSWAAVPGFPGTVIAVPVEYTQNVDYYVSSNPGSGANCSGFTGATGVGCGLLSARPSTCTTGVAYWASDQGPQGTLYKCTGNAWSSYYQPYTYPHPLDTSGSQVATPSISPVSGTYSSPQTISVSDSTSGATLCYTTDGSTPTANGAGTCTHGTTYSSPFSQTIPGTVKAIGSKSGLTDSSVATNSYTLPPSNNPPAPAQGQFLNQIVPQAPPPFGNWQGTYGKDGFWLANSTKSLPAYATVSSSSPTWTWAASTSDPRATQVPGDGRIAACWYSGPTLSFDVNFVDGKTHPFELYLLDWDGMSGGRAETVTLRDASTGKVLDTRTINSFQNGTYLEYQCSGHFTVSVTSTNSANSVVSALFFG